MSRLTKLLAAQLQTVSNEEILTETVERKAPVHEVGFEDGDQVMEAEVSLEPELNQQEELSQIRDTLEEYDEIIAEAEENGGLRPVEGRSISVAVEHFQRRLGLEVGAPSLEDFAGFGGRVASTEDLKTKVGNAIKYAIDMIKELIRRITDKIRSFASETMVFGKGLLKLKTLLDAGYDFDVVTGTVTIGKANALDEYVTNLADMLTKVDKLIVGVDRGIAKTRAAIREGDVNAARTIIKGTISKYNDDFGNGLLNNVYSLKEPENENDLPMFKVEKTEGVEPKEIEMHAGLAKVVAVGFDLQTRNYVSFSKKLMGLGKSILDTVSLAEKQGDQEMVNLINQLNDFYNSYTTLYQKLRSEHVHLIFELIPILEKAGK